MISKEQKKLYNATYREANKEKVQAIKKAYRESHSNEIKAARTDYYNTLEGRALHLISNYRRLDKRYNRGECTLTAPYLIRVLWPMGCVYCGEMDWHKLGADRKDNSKAHTPENVVCCCASCNCKKHNTYWKDYMNSRPIKELKVYLNGKKIVG